MPQVHLYVTESDYPAVKRLSRALKKQRMSLSEWFARQVLRHAEKEREESDGK